MTDETGSDEVAYLSEQYYTLFKTTVDIGVPDDVIVQAASIALADALQRYISIAAGQWIEVDENKVH